MGGNKSVVLYRVLLVGGIGQMLPNFEQLVLLLGPKNSQAKQNGSDETLTPTEPTTRTTPQT